MWSDGFVYFTVENSYGVLDEDNCWLEVAYPLCTYDIFSQPPALDYEQHARRALAQVVLQLYTHERDLVTRLNAPARTG